MSCIPHTMRSSPIPPTQNNAFADATEPKNFPFPKWFDESRRASASQPKRTHQGWGRVSNPRCASGRGDRCSCSKDD